jgi:Protein of unknown function (DUF2750)
MTTDDEQSTAGPLAPKEIDRILALDAQTRAEWMLEDCARFEQAWGLVDSKGWVVFRLAETPAGRSPWALPLWPRQELAALASRSADEQPRRVDFEALLESLLPEVDQKGWQVLACPGQDNGFSEPAAEFRVRLAQAWDELNEEET